MPTPITLGPDTERVICPHCHHSVETQLHILPGLAAYMSGTLIAMFGCIFGCCLIPCCIEECMEVHHTCPHCQGYLGKFRYICS